LLFVSTAQREWWLWGPTQSGLMNIKRTHLPPRVGVAGHPYPAPGLYAGPPCRRTHGQDEMRRQEVAGPIYYGCFEIGPPRARWSSGTQGFQLSWQVSGRNHFLCLAAVLSVPSDHSAHIERCTAGCFRPTPHRAPPFLIHIYASASVPLPYILWKALLFIRYESIKVRAWSLLRPFGRDFFPWRPDSIKSFADNQLIA